MQKMYDEKTFVKLKLVDGLRDLNDDLPAIMFIRHGDRNKIPDGEFGNDVELNETGWSSSQALGTLLKNHQVNKIYTSPIIRCVQTAKSISSGIGKDIPIEYSAFLGHPGAFVYDGHAAGQTYLRLGFRRFYHDLLNGVPLDGNLPVTEGSEILTNFFKSTSAAPGLNIHVSHDMIVALYAFGTFRKTFMPDVNWVRYLEGVIFQLEIQ